MRRFLPLLLLATVLASCGDDAPDAGPPGRGRVTGTVLLSPTCPVETAESPCPGEPLAGVTVRATSGGDTVATTRSDEQGRFTLDLVPGTYAVQAVPEDDPARSAEPIEVTVEADETVEVTVPVDSGIR